jgi:hypothetical protein
MSRDFLRWVGCAGITAVFVPSLLFAQPSLIIGTSTQRDALAALGTPEEKIEKESKRESVWKYPDGRTVRFTDGVVRQDSVLQKRKASMEDQGEKNMEQSPPSVFLSQRQAKNAAGSKSLPFTGRDVFREISKLESSDEPSSGPPGKRGIPRRPSR